MTHRTMTMLAGFAMLAGLIGLETLCPPPGVAGWAEGEADMVSRTYSVGPPSGRVPDYNLNCVPPVTDYAGPLFRLSQDYPPCLPPIDPKLAKILEIPFGDGDGEGAREFLLALRDYCFEGNLEVDWRGQDNAVRKWYHPWPRWYEIEREAIRGLAYKATFRPRPTAGTQAEPCLIYEVGLYNARGGYTIGQVWKDRRQPDPGADRFPVGTVAAKLFFTQATAAIAPSLTNPVEWRAFVLNSSNSSARSVQALRLVRMEVTARVPDGPGSSTGWVVGSYRYDGAGNRTNRWENLIADGLRWGDAPTVTGDPRGPDLDPPSPLTRSDG